MRHTQAIEGFGLRLRPVRMEDAPFLVWLRGMDYVRKNIGDSAADTPAQERWLQAYFEREGDYYFIVETQGGIPVGTHGIYDIRGTSAESGRHVMRPEVLTGVATGILAIDLAFGPLGLTELRSTTAVTNVKVRSLHRRYGYKEVGVIPGGRIIDGTPVDLIEFLLLDKEWPAVRKPMFPLATFASTQLAEWDRDQQGKHQPWA